MKYRADIDGLRALAVVPVVFFHAGLPVFPGGFVGVSVFFVISGYLMASMIGDGLARGDFSFAGFYERRVRRIFPALFAVLFFCAVVAAFVVPPKLLAHFGATLAATVLFASNIDFWIHSANYFDAPSELNPLLHTWSLAVEEQFYIVFPVFLWLIWRYGPRWRLGLTALVAAVSLALSVWGASNAPTATFYLLPTRAWELLLGAMVALWARPAVLPWVSHASGAAGLGLVVASLVWFDREMLFPGASALVPTVGAALLIWSGQDARSLAARLLALAPLVFIGQISYSLYLWHWPLLVFVEKYNLLGTPGVAQKLVILCASFVAAYLSWRWVELPFRRRSLAPSRARILQLSLACTAALGIAGFLVRDQAGWPERFPGMERVAFQPQADAEASEPGWNEHVQSGCFLDRRQPWGGERCFLNRNAPSNALLWGDSFAASYASGFFRNDAPGLNVLQYTAPQCPPIVGYEAVSRPQCAPFNADVARIIKQYRISTVIMAANWRDYFRRKKVDYQDIQATERFLRGLGVRVLVVGQSPAFTFVYPDEYFYKTFGTQLAERPYYAPLDLDPGINARMRSLLPEDAFIDPLALLCTGAQCIFKEGRLYLFLDYGHYTNYGSRKVVNALFGKK